MQTNLQKLAKESSKKEFIKINISIDELLDKEIKKGNCKHLFVYEFSRLSRKGFWSEWLRREFLEYDIKLWEGENGKPIDLSNPTDKMISGILNQVYEYERNNLVKRIKSGLEESYEKGKWGGVQVPYGYKRDDDGLVVIDKEQAEIYYRMVNMIHKGKSIRDITNWLNSNNIPTNSVKAIDKGFIEYDKNGEEVNRVIGLKSKPDLKELFNDLKED